MSGTMIISGTPELRAKIGEKGDYIKTIWGMGYKFEAEENGSDK